MKFGENLRNLRKMKKLSQEELAEKVGVSRQSISKWECGDAYPEMNNILELCNIFHCQINDLIQENMLDINSLGENVKESVVKFAEVKQKRMKGLSKTLYLIARFLKIFNFLGIALVTVAMVLTIVLAFNTKKDANSLKVFDTTVKYEEKENEIILKYNNEQKVFSKNSEVIVLQEAIKVIENKSIQSIAILIEITFITLLIVFIFLNFIFKSIEKLFINLHDGETPFTLENVSYIKKIAYYLMAVIIIPNIVGLTMELIANINLGIGFEVFDIVYILGLFSLAYVFEYGHEIQKNLKSSMYGKVS